MIRSLPILIFVLGLHPLIGQKKLVLNPGLETFSSCPDDYQQIFRAEEWGKATDSLPDFYHRCAIKPGISVPHAGIYNDSYQQPHQGDAFAGIYVFHSNPERVRTYLQTQLSRPLTPNKQYYLEFFAAPDISPTQPAVYTDAIAMAISDTFYYKPSRPGQNIPLKPFIQNKDFLLRDSAGWTKVSGAYKAKGEEEFIVIGNFLADRDTRLESMVSGNEDVVSYFYIDDVQVTLFDPLPDTVLLCDGETAVFDVSFIDGNYLWSTGDKSPRITVNSTDQYSIEVFLDKGVLTDTVHVFEINTLGSLPADTTICQNEPFNLYAPVPGNYRWTGNLAGTSLPITQSGTYELTVTNACGSYTFFSQVNVSPCVCDVFVPNVFSPNNDGINDILSINVGCRFGYTFQKLQIFNRWGNLVFQEDQQENAQWDGLINRQSAPLGTYIWSLAYELIVEGVPRPQKATGSVLLVR